MTRSASFLGMAGILALLAIVPAASAAPVGASDVLVFHVGSTNQTANLGGTATFVWLVYNNGSTQYFVSFDVAPVDALGIDVSRPDFLLSPSESVELWLNVMIPESGSARTYLVAAEVRALDLATGTEDSTTVTMTLSVTGVTAAENPRGKLLGRYPNVLPAPFDNEWGAFLATVLVWVGVSLFLVFVVDPVVRQLTKRTKTQVDDIVLRILRVPLFALVILWGSVESLGILGLPASLLGQLAGLRGFVIILIATWVGYRMFRDVLIHYGRGLSARTRSDTHDRLIPALEKIGAVVIVIVGVILAVQSLGYDITLFLAGLGVMGLVLAFAAQDTLSNFFSGIHLMLDRPFRAGDLIELESGEICEVRDIGLRSTKLHWGRANTTLILPNNRLAGTKIVNYMRPDSYFRVHVTVGVAYGSDIDRVRRAMLSIVDAHPRVVTDDLHRAAFQVDDLGDSAILVRVICWVRHPGDQWSVASEVREELLKRFAAEGIEIPFPQRVVWSRGPQVPPARNDSQMTK